MNPATANRLWQSLREALRDDRPAVADQVASLLEAYLDRHGRRIGPVLRAVLDQCHARTEQRRPRAETDSVLPIRPPADDLEWAPDGRTSWQTTDGRYRVERLSKTCYLASRGLAGLGAYTTPDQARRVCRQDADEQRPTG